MNRHFERTYFVQIIQIVISQDVYKFVSDSNRKLKCYLQVALSFFSALRSECFIFAFRLCLFIINLEYHFYPDGVFMKKRRSLRNFFCHSHPLSRKTTDHDGYLYAETSDIMFVLKHASK